MNFKVATWNVNSLRVRLPQVLTWLDQEKPDVLALQEIKITDADFPLQAFQDAGYASTFSGQKTYNGVAVISRQRAIDVITHFPDWEDPQRRILGVTIGDIRILNVYIPNGERVGSEKYEYKLRWLKRLESFIKAEFEKYARLIVLGDFNIAPDELDVYDPAAWEGQVLFSQPERMAFKALLDIGFKDCFRCLSPVEKQFSWWDYRVNAFKRNMGLRIDHILADQSFSLKCYQSYVDKIPRSWERPSDHAPVVALFNVDETFF